LRELAPISDEAWEQIDAEARRSLKHFLAARRLVDFNGPLGWECSSVGLGRIEGLSELPAEGVEAAGRKVLPMVEFRAAFSLDQRIELAAAERGASDLDLSAVIAASRSAALAEDGAIFHGYGPGGISRNRPVVALRGGRHQRRLQPLPRACGQGGRAAAGRRRRRTLRNGHGSTGFTGVIETTEHGGYPSSSIFATSLEATSFGRPQSTVPSS
jgi:hypothetical protein